MGRIQAALSSGDRDPLQDVVSLVIVEGDVSDLAAPGQLMTDEPPVIDDVTVPFADLTAAANAHNALLAALRLRGAIGGS